MEPPPVINFTRETVICYGCEKKQDDEDPPNRGRWREVLTKSRRSPIPICGDCVIYYAKKSKASRGLSGFQWWSYTDSDPLVGTSVAETSSSDTTGQVNSVEKLVADSQRRIGVCLAR